METYFVIISAGIFAIAIAYKIATNLRDNANTFKAFPIVAREGNYVLSFPVITSNESINPVVTGKVYLTIKQINENDVAPFAIMASSIDWGLLINNMINNNEIDYDCPIKESLENHILIECTTETLGVIKLKVNANGKISKINV
jgi:hypothetical protein